MDAIERMQLLRIDLFFEELIHPLDFIGSSPCHEIDCNKWGVLDDIEGFQFQLSPGSQQILDKLLQTLGTSFIGAFFRYIFESWRAMI